MGWLEGVLTGYADRHYEIQKQKREDAEKAATREQQVLSSLLASEYPEIRDYAAAGVLDLANPRRRSGGVAGWMGEMDKSPYLPMIQRSRAHIAEDPEYAEGQLGYPPTTPSIPTPAGQVANQPSAALPETSLTTGGPPSPPTPAPTPTPAPPPRPPMSASFAPGGSAAPNVTPPQASFAPPPTPPGVQAAQAQGAAPPQAGPPMAPPQPPAGPPLPVSGPPPPPPGQVSKGLPGATTATVGPQAAVRPTRTQLPGIFPSAADLSRQKERADVLGQVEGWQTLYREQGDPDWQKKGIEAVLNAKRSALGGGLKEGNVRQAPDGSWLQDLYDPYTGKIVNTIPSAGPLAGGTVGTKDSLAFELFGDQGEDPRETMRRISPSQMARVNEELRHRTALQAAEVSLARAEAMADAPLTAQAKSQLIEALNSKWQKLQAPVRDTARSFEEMQLGLKRFMATGADATEVGGRERLASVEMIRVAFERILDPTSVVREGEYARQVRGLSLTKQMEGMWQRVIEGGAEIPASELAGMVETTRQFMEKMQGWNDLERGRIEDRAHAHNIDPGYIFGGGVQPKAAVDPANPAATANSAAKPGATPKVAGPAGFTVDQNGNLIGPDGVIIK